MKNINQAIRHEMQRWLDRQIWRIAVKLGL